MMYPQQPIPKVHHHLSLSTFFQSKTDTSISVADESPSNYQLPTSDTDDSVSSTASTPITCGPVDTSVFAYGVPIIPPLSQTTSDSSVESVLSDSPDSHKENCLDTAVSSSLSCTFRTYVSSTHIRSRVTSIFSSQCSKVVYSFLPPIPHYPSGLRLPNMSLHHTISRVFLGVRNMVGKVIRAAKTQYKNLFTFNLRSKFIDNWKGVHSTRKQERNCITFLDSILQSYGQGIQNTNLRLPTTWVQNILHGKPLALSHLLCSNEITSKYTNLNQLLFL
ncbi:hypothetical protein CANINC_000561 [Pichia inconspicua]|uniref:Uncharacterized protein n=1 Tax=Pichia inconspicua TaxID=52247 RepID=A0A4T0X5U7_9ASCO|nr:hypothetical protein CANINC_000561 [[Candida] inconspicua]